jgi:thiol-disulfide isomerase/thioredoxin
MKTFRLLAAIVAAGLFLRPVRAETVAPTPAPGWELKDVDGKPVNFSSFKGKVVVLDFWATWCPPCRSEIPGYVKLQEKYKDKGLVIIGVSLDQAGPDVVKKFIGDFHLNYQVVMGDEAVVQAFGGVEGIPTTFIIDRTGKIRDKKVGAMETAEYEQVLLQYLN